jgi:trimethylamine--corrinoid protein Co-methyltransferase
MKMTDNRPMLNFLTQADKDRIHQAALYILSEIGMQILHEEALTLLQNAGCTVEDDHMVKIPATLVANALKTVPHTIAIYNREGTLAMELGGYRSYFGTGSDLMYHIEPEHFTRYLCTLADVKQTARLCDALENIDFIMSCAYPSEIDPHQAYLQSFQAMAESSVKPIVCTAECRDDLSAMWEIARILRGSEEALRAQPYFIQYAEPISPLKHPLHSLEKLLFCAEKRIPVIYSPAPLSGSNAPITIAGHVAQGLAESFCGLVIHQLKTPDAPFIMGMGPAVLDMATSQSSYNAPEYYLAYMGMIEMCHYYDLPSWGYAGTSDSQIPDGQATLESGMLTFLATLAGANLNHDVGYLNFGLTGSLEMIVITDEIISQIRRIMQGIPVNDDTLGLDAIQEVGYTGNHLIHPHTLKHLRTIQWRPKLLNRKGYEQWEKDGSLTLLERARNKLVDILAKHEPAAIPVEKVQAIYNRVKQFKG